jgi:serine/threonine-protein kinase ULK/ATG1
MVIKQKNVIHRDLKLPNVLINFKEMPVDVFRMKIQGKKVEFDMQEYLKTVDLVGKSEAECPIEIKIADLGFARKLDEDQLAATHCGTPLMMAPQILLGDFYDHKADVWSLGCVFYEMLTGFTPFTGTSKQNLTQNIKKGDYSIPKTLKISLEGISFLNSCLQFDANKRLTFEDLVRHPYITFDPR